MKKLFYFLLCFFLTLTACTDQQEAVAPLGNNMYRISVATDNGISTRAEAPVQTGVTPRYILEIYNNGEVYNRFVQTTPQFQFRLLTNQTYDFLVWVDYTLDGITDYHYNTGNGLKNISIIGSYSNNDHSRDAFFGKQTATIESLSQDFGSIVCKRPFGQLNIKTTDWTNTNSAGGDNAQIKPTAIHMKFDAPIAFNVFDGTVSGSDTFEYNYNLAISNQDADTQDLTCDYIFTAASGAGQISPVITFVNANGDEITNTATYLANLPVQRNYQTNVSGQLITKIGKVNISIDAEWSTPNNDLVRPAEETSTFYILPDDPNLNPTTGVYTINPSNIDPQDNSVVLIFDGISSGRQFTNPSITIVIPDNLPSNIQTIIIDPSLSNTPLSFILSNTNFSGTVIFRSDLPSNNTTINVNNLNIYLPNGSLILTSKINVLGDMTVWTKDSTFITEAGSVINGKLTINGGRAILNGEVKGIIYVYGDSKVDIVKNGTTKSYWTSAIADKGASKWYGFGVDINGAIGSVLPGFTLPDFLNLSFNMNYSGAYAAFDFGNHTNGLNWNEMRNVRYDYYAADGTSGSAKLKKDLNINFGTPADLQEALNKPANDLKAELNKKVAEVNAMVEQYATVLPPKVTAALRAEVKKLQDAVNYFNSQLPVVQLPAGPQVPLATILPAADNFNFATVAQLIGKPGDKFNILDIPSYINGSKPLTIYMIIDFLTGYQNTENAVATLKAQKATLEAQKATLNAEKATINAQLTGITTEPTYVSLTNQLNTLVTEYDAMPKPANGPNNIIGIPSWVFVPATKAEVLPITRNNYFINKWSVAYGTPNAAEMTKMNNCNAKIDAIEAKLSQRVNYYNQQAGALGTQLTAIDNQIKAIDKKINGSIENLFLDGLNAQITAAETQASIFQGALEQLGIPKDTINSIIGVVNTIEPYLATVADVANTVNNVMDKIQSSNPWEYPTKLSYKKPIVRMEVDATFEYESGKILHLYNK